MKGCKHTPINIRRDGPLAVSIERNRCLSCRMKKRCAQSHKDKAKNNYQSPDKKAQLKINKFTIHKSSYPQIKEGQLINCSGKRQVGFTTERTDKGKIKIIKVIYGRTK